VAREGSENDKVMALCHKYEKLTNTKKARNFPAHRGAKAGRPSQSDKKIALFSLCNKRRKREKGINRFTWKYAGCVSSLYIHGKKRKENGIDQVFVYSLQSFTLLKHHLRLKKRSGDSGTIYSTQCHPPAL
jgi:hypothetical protein